jgi:hypothetical protein
MLFGACIAVGAWVYVAVAGGRRYRRIERDAFTFTLPAPWVHVRPGIYDWQAREDFHDPIRDHAWCDDCNARLRRVFNRLGDLDLGPRDADVLMAAIRRELDS